jgi:hypothetical protein
MIRYIIIFILFSSRVCNAQEMWGISNSNYSGNMGIFLNPSTIVGAPYKYEINLIAADLFAENTYFYFPKEENAVLRTLTGNPPEGKKYFFLKSDGRENGFGHALIIGPSYINNSNDEFAWGLHTAFRSELSATNIPATLAHMLYDGFNSPQFYNQKLSHKPFQAAMATWGELGGTYGRVYSQSETTYLKWAATGNVLIGFNGMYIDASKFDHTLIDSSLMTIHSMRAQFAHAPANDDDDSFLGLRGAGLSTTLGVTYMKNRIGGGFACNNNNDRIKKYKYRIGVSLMDLGMIHYFNESRVSNIVTSTDRDWIAIDSVKTSSISSADSLLLSHIGGATKEESFNVILPLALSVQFDYSIRPYLYANLSVVNRIRFAANQIARGNQVNVSGRYETRKFEANLNFSYFEYKQPSLGLGIRYRWFVIGTDRLLQLFSLTDVQGFDLFFGIKFQFCKRPFSPGEDCPAYL